jgi:16S rRNA (uracil1498-N3)-methyltransferase
MHRFRAPRDELRTGRVRLRGGELRHLRDALRIGAGACVALFDGEGGTFLAEVVSIGRSSAELDVLGSIERRAESALSLALAVAITKGAKLDWVVEKATELGASRILPFTSERTIPERPDFGERVRRWRRIAGAAVAQCGRAVCPEVCDVTSLAAVLRDGHEHDRRVLFWEEGGLPLTGAPDGGVRSVLVVIGPEGGFDPEEVVRAEAAGFTLAALGPRILRADTAAVTAVTLAQFLWGDMGRSPGWA